jgi:peptide/nickel transport system substrate-binding protein
MAYEAGLLKSLLAGLFISFILNTGTAFAEPKHGIAMYGEPALPHDFVSLPYANANAPKGGSIISAEGGTFTSLNPHVRKGNVPWQLRFLAYESLMGRSYDEPFSLYGLLAESIETDDSRRWVEFTLNPKAKFSDGTPVTVEDIIWSYETLGTIGHPRYHGLWKKIETIEKISINKVKFTFNSEDRELVLLVGLRPILKKSQWDGKDFVNSGLNEVPISTAPYVITDFDPGNFVKLTRNPSYWGAKIPFRQGTNNFDEIRLDFYADGSVQFEAFKAGESSSFRELNAERWENSYDFKSVEDGSVVKSIIPHQRPSGITGFVMNTRLPKFADWRVREALIAAFNFEFINQSNTGGRQKRIQSYFSNSVLSKKPGPATGVVRTFLQPHAANLLPGTMEGYTLPVSDGTVRNRKNIKIADELLNKAGWRVINGLRKNSAGKPFEIVTLLKQGDTESQSMMAVYQQALERLGIKLTTETLDSAQYKERTQIYDYDVAYYRRGLSLSPGNEQMLYWGSEGIDKPGTRNWMGMNSPAAEDMISRLVSSKSHDHFLAAAQALDRILTAGRYVIPIHTNTVSRLAHIKEIKFPERLPMYGDWIGFLPDVWWYEAQ